MFDGWHTILEQDSVLGSYDERLNGTVQSVVTSPPYWRMRDYHAEGQLGLEKFLEAYVERIALAMNNLLPLLKDDGTLWLNLGDRSVDKSLCGIPWKVVEWLRASGWVIRQEIIWSKPNGKCESVKDRPTRTHETLFFLSKNKRYYYDQDAIREEHGGFERRKHLSGRGRTTGDGHRSGKTGLPAETLCSEQAYHPNGRNKRSVWEIPVTRCKGAHFAPMPKEMALTCILASSRPGDVVMDPFCGTGTTGVVAIQQGRRFLGCEINPRYIQMAEERIQTEALGTMMKELL